MVLPRYLNILSLQRTLTFFCVGFKYVCICNVCFLPHFNCNNDKKDLNLLSSFLDFSKWLIQQNVNSARNKLRKT